MSFLHVTFDASAGAVPEPLDAIAADIATANGLGMASSLLPALQALDVDQVLPGAPTARALAILSFLAHSYIWSTTDGREEIPEILSVPWVTLARRCDVPPVLSYASYVLNNLRPSLVGPEVPALTFTGSSDELWFILVHQRIERVGAPIVELARRAGHDADDQVCSSMQTVAGCLEAICEEARRMEEGCDPHVYFSRIRRFLFGWRWNPLYRGRRMIFRGIGTDDLYGDGQYVGESGSQSPLLPLVDRLLGIRHVEPFRSFSEAMQAYMYPEHRRLLDEASQSALSGRAVMSEAGRLEHLRALTALREFRTIHLNFVATYITDQARLGSAEVSVGTAGSHAVVALDAARRAVEERIAVIGG